MQSSVEHRSQPYPEYDDRFTLAHFFQTLQSYRRVILLATISVVVAYLLGVAATLLIAPARRITTIHFRIQFDGSAGYYPNRTRFTTADITSTPVLLAVYEDNKLKDYLTFGEFSRSVFILEANREFEELSREYRAKLADPKLSPIDRERIEREFESKVRGIGKFDYSINFVAPNRVRTVPRAIVRKVLGDVLAEWANQAANEKRVLQYAVPVYSQNLLRTNVTADGLLRSILLLRQRVGALVSNIDEIAKIPGADVMRTTQERVSLAEIRLELNDIARYDLDPLLNSARAAGLTGSHEDALQTLESQLRFDQRQLNLARAREAALRNALLTYEAQVPSREQAITTREPGRREAAPAEGETVNAQLTDTFLDRIVDLANRSADLEYRQTLTDEIKAAALAVPSAEAAVLYDEALLKLYRDAAPTSPSTSAEIQQRWDDINGRVARAINQMNEIYQLTSRQLNAQSALFSVTSEATSRVERAISLERMAVFGLLLLLLSIPAIIGGCLIHNRIRQEVSEESRVPEGGVR